jgi:hypothetical protein
MIISLKNNLFLPWYSWKIAELALNNNHSLTHSLKCCAVDPVGHWNNTPQVDMSLHWHIILSPLKLCVWILLKRGVLDATLSDKVCQWLVAGRWFSPGILVSSTNKTDSHDITEILLNVTLNTITLILHIMLTLQNLFVNHIVPCNCYSNNNLTKIRYLLIFFSLD